MRHIIGAAAVVLVVNAQLTWWIIFILGQNRDRLELERGRLLAMCEQHAGRVARAEAEARADLEAALAGGRVPGVDAAPEPFGSWRMVAVPNCTDRWWTDGSVRLTVAPAADLCVEAVPREDWLASLRQAPSADLEVVPAGEVPVRSTSLSGARLSGPLGGLEVHPTENAWELVLRDYRRRIVMMVSEGSFFALLLFVLMALLWRTIRREVELERQHRNFLSAITHELKSPLAAMRLSLETVRRGRADPTTSERFLDNALKDTERLQDLVQKVLEVTRYGRGDRSVTPQRSCLSDLVTDAVETFRGRALAEGATLRAEVEPGVWLAVDTEAFPIVVSNLLENAFKYAGARADVAVRLSAVDGEAVLDVSDDGPGIPEREIPLIFNRFYRGGEEMTRTTRGTGLGLYLVRQIATAHGGRVDVERTGPDGTTFRVRIPGAERWEESA